jgi:hypothetical protein
LKQNHCRKLHDTMQRLLTVRNSKIFEAESENP